MRVLLSSADLKELYRISNPKLKGRPALRLVRRDKKQRWDNETTYTGLCEKIAHQAAKRAHSVSKTVLR